MGLGGLRAPAVLSAALAVLSAGVLLLALAAAPVGAQSLWNARSGSLVTDIKAARAGDIVTILVDEQSTAEKKAETELNRDGEYTSSLSLPKLNARGLRDFLEQFETTGTGTSDYTGKGSQKRTDKATATLTARVIRVLDNGNLLLEGRRLVVVQDETQTIVVTGIVRAVDVLADNTVRSSQIADAEVRIEGKGAISLRQKPGLFQRVFDWLGFY